MATTQETSKSIPQQIQEIAEEMCNNYCHWPYVWSDEDGDLADSEHCTNCPLNRLM